LSAGRSLFGSVLVGEYLISTPVYTSFSEIESETVRN